MSEYRRASYVFGLTTMVILIPSLVFAQNTFWIDAIASESRDLIERVILLLSLLSFAYFVWGAIVFIQQAGNEEARAVGRKRMMWGIVALFVMVTVWGFVHLLQGIVSVNPTSTVTAPRVNLN